MAINVGDNFSYQGKKYLDNRQSFKTLSELQAYSNVPEGFIAYCEEDKKRYEYTDGVWTEYVVASSGTEVNPDCATKEYVDGLIESHTHEEYLTEHQDISHLATKEEIPSLDGLVTTEELEQKGYLTEHQDISHLATKDEIPSLEGLVTTEELEQKGYLTEHQDISHLATKAEIPSVEGLATETYVQEQIANASLGGGEGGSIDTSNFATKAELNTKFDDVEVNEEETTDSQTALDFFANGEKVKTVYFSGGGGGGAAAAYISTTLPEEAMVETGYDFDILIDFYSPNPGKGTLKVFVNDVDALSTPILQGETTTTLSHEKLTKGTNKIVVYVLDRIGTMSNSLTFYVRYGSTELVGEFDSSLAYDYGANIRYYFTATALDTSLALTFYMSIDGAVQNGVSCVSDVRGYFTFPNSLEAGGHYCECWVEDSNGGRSNVETFNLVILDTNTLAIVTETRNPSVEEGSQLVLDYRVYKKNETTFIIKTYVDEELVSTGTCGLTTSYYKTTTLREGMHNIKIEAWDITETVSDYITWSVIITPSTYTMLEPIKAGSMFMATAKNRTNGDPNRETWTGYNQDGEAIDCTLYNFAFNSESGWMDDQLFITGNSYVEVPIQPLANNARYGFTLDVEFLTKPIGVDDAEVLSLWNDTDNCGIKITTEQLILQSKTGNKCELYFSENEIVSAIFIIDRHEKTAKVYLNGVMCAAFALSDYTAEGVSYLEDFTVNDNLYLGKPGSNGYATIKNLRIYELALSSSEILNNFMANEIDKAKQQELVNFQKGEDLPTVTVYCDFSGLGKDDKKYCDIVYNSPDPVKYGESFSLMGKYSQLQYQGTSSMQYPIKNYRLNPRDADGKVKIKLPNCQPETRFTLKADFMSSGHWQNTGLTKWINDNLYNYKEDDPKTMNPAKWWAIQNGKDPNDYRECIYGFPCRLILVNDGTSPLNEGQQEPTPGNTKDMGIFNFNLDKDCENSLGFKIDDFPNALSMEVTANSDTSAGAFMSYNKEARIMRYVEGGDCWTARLILSEWPDVLEVSSNVAMIAYYDVNAGYVASSVITNNTINIGQYKDSAYKYFSLGSWPGGQPPEIITINGDNYIPDPVLATEEDKIYSIASYDENPNAELDYIKESFELRYPDEDDVPEGWGFMGIDNPLTVKRIDYWIQNKKDRLTSVFSKIDSITVETQNNTTFAIALYNYEEDTGVYNWTQNIANGSASGATIDLSSYSEGFIAIRVDGSIYDEYVFVNGEKWYYGNTIDSNAYGEPYAYDTGETYFDTSYGLKALIDWVDNSTDDQFVAEFEEHFHKDYTLRYFLLVMVLGMVDNLGKNMMLDSYDGKIWMPRFYDCDTICSYDNSGAIKFDVDIEMQQGYWNTSSSRLWTRVRDLFHDELVVKYNDMRQNGLSFESLMNVFYNEQIAKIPQKYYNMDADVKYLPYADEYLGKAHGDGYEHLKRWLKNRIIFTDSLYDYAPSYTNDMITFRANTTEEMSITIETYTPVYQHVSWYNGNMQKEKITKGTQLTFKGFAQAATDQEVLVYGGSNIKRIIGISTMNPNSMLIGNATRLVELDISDCPILTDINSNKANFTPHTYLSKLDISNCPQLGGSLRLNYSPLIGEINAMNTAVTDLQLPSSIRNLHTLKVPGALTNLTLNDGPVLSTLEFDGPNNLQSVNLTNCNALTNIVNFDMTQIPTVTLNNSYDADELYMSKTTNLSLVNMANVKKLIFVPNNEHETFNLTELRNCPDYTISAINCPNLKTFMTTAGYRESYKNDAFIGLKFSSRQEIDVYWDDSGNIQTSSFVHIHHEYSCDGVDEITFTKVNPYDAIVTGAAIRCTFFSGETFLSRSVFKDVGVYTVSVPRYCDKIIFVLDIEDDYVINDTKIMNLAFCANTLDISNTKITDVNFLCTTDVYQLKLPDTVNNFICDSAYDLDTDYLPDGDFDTVHHELIEAYTTDYTSNVVVDAVTTVACDDSADIKLPFASSSDWWTDYFDASGIIAIDITGNGGGYIGYGLYDANKNVLIEDTNSKIGSTGYMELARTDATYIRLYGVHAQAYNLRGLLYKKRPANLIPSAADGSLIFSMYAPNTNVAVPAEGIWDLYGLTFEEFYTYGMNNDIVVTDGNITMPHRYADYNVTIQNANIKPTNHPTMLYPLLVNENKPIVGTIDYSDYQGDDLSYAMAYANKSEVDISIPNNVAMNTQYFHNVDKESEYEYNDPRTIAKYTCNAKGVLPTFNSDYTAYKVAETDNGDGTYTTSIIADDINILPSSISFQSKTQLLELHHINGNGLTTVSNMFNGCSNLTYANMSGAITNKVTSMAAMFHVCTKLQDVDVSGWDTSGVKDITNMFKVCTSLTSLDVSNWDTSSLVNASTAFQQCSSLTSLDVSNWDISSVTNMANIFYGCSSLTSLDVSNWNTSSATHMENMFRGCSKLTSLDVSNWDTSKVTDMSYIFLDCSSLTSLDVSNWNTSSATNMGSMFQSCSSLTSLDVSNWDTSSVTNMSGMFWNCSSLTSLDLSSWDTSSVTNMAAMFRGCSSLTSLDLSSWDTSSVTNTSLTFGGCSKLTSIEWTNWKPSVDLSNAPLSTESLKNLLSNLATVTGGQTLTLGATNLAKVSTADILGAQLKGWTLDGATSTAVVFASDTISGNDTVTECAIQLTQTNKGTRIGEVMNAYTACTKIYLFEDGSVTDLSYMTSSGSIPTARLQEIYFLADNFENVTSMFMGFMNLSKLEVFDTGNWTASKLTNMTNAFQSCSSLREITVGRWDVGELSSLQATFNGCSSLTSLDVSGWDTSSVTTMQSTFNGCSSLTSLDVSGWDTSKVTTMQSTFNGCSSLTSLDLSNWDTSSVTNMSYMFNGCSKLTSLDVSNWDTSKVTNMSNMFQNCSKLTSIDLSAWDFGKVTTMAAMFQDANVLLESCIPVVKSSELQNIAYMFTGCNAITELDLSGWDIPNIVNVGGLFYYTRNVTTINLSGWDTSKVTNSSMLFFTCSALTTVDLSGWDLSNVSSSGSEFTYCGNLTQLYWTNWKSSIDISPSTKFTKDTLVDLLNNLAIVTDKTLKMGSTNLAKLTDSEKAIAINKGWTLA